MAVPTGFDESNCILTAPAGMTSEQVAPLNVFRDGEHVISCWKLTREELEEVGRTGRLWLWVWGHTMPPVAITTQHQFKPADEGTNPQ